MYTDEFTLKISETVQVEKMLSDLVPGFIKNKFDDLETINSLIENSDFSKIKKIGHNWKGACPSYGFTYLGEVGKQFEILVQNRDYDTLQALVKSLPSYLKNVNVEYID